MYIFHFKIFIDLSILLKIYAKLFKISLAHIGEFSSGKPYLYEYYEYPAGEFCSIFRIYASTSYIPELDFNLQEIQLASDISKILQQDVMTILPNADSPYMWLLVRGEQYFAVAELFVDKFTNDEENDYGICLDYSTQKQISFPKSAPTKLKGNE